jgi:predicted enzyme related to lactoylglutathione lyase
MNNNPVGWFEIYVQDMDRAKAFYETIFEVQLARLAQPEAADGQPAPQQTVTGGLDMWTFPMQSEGYGAPGALVRMEGFDSGANSVLVYFGCDDCAVEAGRVPGAGGKIIKEKFSLGQYGYAALVTDTEGNMIGLHSMA